MTGGSVNGMPSVKPHALPQRDRDGLGVGAERVPGGQVRLGLPARAEYEQLAVDRFHHVLVRDGVQVARRIQAVRPVTGVPLALQHGDGATRLWLRDAERSRA